MDDEIVVNNLPAYSSPTTSDIVLVIKNADGSLTQVSLGNVKSMMSEVFWATYNTTTSADIEAAYQAGKLCCVQFNGRTYPLVYRTSSTAHAFALVNGTTIYQVQCLNGTWTASSNAMAKASDIPTTASEVGAIPAPSSPTSGQFLQWNGSAWVAASLPVYNGGVS